MRKIHILIHKFRYESAVKPIRAYESETDAQAMLELLTGIVRGELEIVPVDLEVIKDQTFNPVGPTISSGVFHGVPLGRAELT